MPVPYRIPPAWPPRAAIIGPVRPPHAVLITIYWNLAWPVRLPLPISPCVNASANPFGGFGLNLGIPTLPLRLAILDDPLQSLDDLNLLGLVDLLKRTREHRQLMISTHDVRFASLLERKLRPVDDFHRTIRVDLGGWTSEGPIVTQHDIARDPEPMRLAAD